MKFYTQLTHSNNIMHSNRTSNVMFVMYTLRYFKYDITTHISDFKTKKYKHLIMYTMPYTMHRMCNAS